MECDEDQGIGDSNKSFNSIDAIAKEARTVYNQLKMLHFTLKGNHDGDSGMFPFFLALNQNWISYYRSRIALLLHKINKLILFFRITFRFVFGFGWPVKSIRFKWRITSRDAISIDRWYHQFNHEHGCRSLQDDVGQVTNHNTRARRRTTPKTNHNFWFGMQSESTE